MRLRKISPVFVAVLLALTPVAGRAAWHQSTFAVGGLGVGGGGIFQLQNLNSVGLDFVLPIDRRIPGDDVSVASWMSFLMADNPTGFKMRDILLYWSPTDSSRLMFNTSPILNESLIKANLNTRNYDSVAGWYIWDEAPLTGDIVNENGDDVRGPQLTVSNSAGNMHDMTRILEDNPATSEKLAFVNLMGMTKPAPDYYRMDPALDEVSAYRAYVDTVLARFSNDNLPLPVLCFDNYPLEFPPGDANYYPQTFFENLAVIRDEAARHSRPNYVIPFWAMIQAAPRKDRYNDPASHFNPSPTFEEVRWQAFVALAYGAKGILYWTTYPLVPAPGDLNREGYGPFLYQENGTPNYPTYLRADTLNNILHELGPTLMRLSPVATYHRAALGMHIPDGDLLLDPHRVYNIVTQLTGSIAADSGMVGYLKDRFDGTDYLLVVNKAVRLQQSYQVTLGSAASQVYEISPTTGQPVLVASGVSAGGSFTTGLLDPGGGRLYKIVDQVSEYIPNVNRIVVANGRTYYAHDKGVVMVNNATGYRTYHHDGPYYTIVSDLVTAGSHVYMTQKSGNNGNVFRTDLNLENPSIYYIDLSAGGGHPGHPMNALDYYGGKLYAAESLSDGTGRGRVVALDTLGNFLGSYFSNTGVRDVVHFRSAPYLAVVPSSGEVLRTNDAGGLTPQGGVFFNPTTGGVPSVAREGLSGEWFVGLQTSDPSQPSLASIRFPDDVIGAQVSTGRSCVDLDVRPVTARLFAAMTGVNRFEDYTYLQGTPTTWLPGYTPRCVLQLTDYEKIVGTAQGVFQVSIPPPPPPPDDPPGGGGRDFDPALRRPEVAVQYVVGTDRIARITVRLPRSQAVRLEAFDVSGRRLVVLANGTLAAGETHYELDTGRMPIGLVCVRARIQGEEFVKRVMVLR